MRDVRRLAIFLRRRPLFLLLLAMARELDPLRMFRRWMPLLDVVFVLESLYHLLRCLFRQLVCRSRKPLEPLENGPRVAARMNAPLQLPSGRRRRVPLEIGLRVAMRMDAPPQLPLNCRRWVLVPIVMPPEFPLRAQLRLARLLDPRDARRLQCLDL